MRHCMRPMHAAGRALAKHLPDLSPSIIFKQNLQKMFTKRELSEYRGVSHDGKLYLAILGQVFDVTKGAEKYYGG